MSTRYEFRIQGHLDHHWTAMLGDLSVRHAADGTTALTGPVFDQSQLHGLLAQLRDLGAVLLSVAALADEPAAAGTPVLEPKPTDSTGLGEMSLEPTSQVSAGPSATPAATTGPRE